MTPVTTWDQVTAYGILFGLIAAVALIVSLLVSGLATDHHESTEDDT